jgi:hypothetical protein
MWDWAVQGTGAGFDLDLGRLPKWRTLLAFGVVGFGLIPMLTACGSSGSGTVAPGEALAVEITDQTVTPGGVAHLRVRGCPQDGPLATDQPRVQVMLAPADGGNNWGPFLDDGKINSVLTAMYVPGESGTSAQPSKDGTAEIEVSVKDDAMVGSDLKATIVCSSLLTATADGQALDEKSVLDATARSGVVRVQ